MEHPVVLLLLWFAVASCMCFFLMYLDKQAASKGEWRTPERKLLFWAYVGGGVGAIVAQRRFRHKTRKEPFRTLLQASVYFNAITFVLLTIPAVREPVFDVLKTLLANLA